MMNRKAPLAVLGSIVLLTMVAAVLVAMDGIGEDSMDARAIEFQETVSGLGLGPDVSLARCPACFDPRVCRRCLWDQGPLPGGGYFCPHHAGSIMYYPPLKRAP